jgi:SAM-dependent methyltransferase
MDIKESEILGKEVGTHWYYRNKTAALKQIVQGLENYSVLDIGAGSGYFSFQLLESGNAISACCVDTGYVEESNQQVNNKLLQYRKRIDSSDAKLVLLMDVLEHVDDDVAVLTEYVRKSPAGALFVISVPAFQFMWSGHDEFLEHKRRYSLTQIEAVASQAGLKLEPGCYYYGLVFPLAFLTRLLNRLQKQDVVSPKSQLRKHHPLINNLLSLLCRIELAFFRHNRIGGLTAFCIAHKPN